HLLDAVDPAELFTVVHTAALATDGLGPELGRTVDSTAKVVGVLDAHAADVRTFLADLSVLSARLSSKGQALIDAARDLSPPLEAVGTKPDALGQLLLETSDLSGRLARVVNDHAAALHPPLNGLS